MYHLEYSVSRILIVEHDSGSVQVVTLLNIVLSCLLTANVNIIVVFTYEILCGRKYWHGTKFSG